MESNINKMRTLIQDLNRWTKLYDEGHPEISDAEWDAKYFELQQLEQETGIVLGNSPTAHISYTVQDKLTKVTHDGVPMLSLAKTKEIDEVKKWAADEDIVASLKMDGLSCRLTYEHGYLLRAETRGNGIVGNDVTHIVRTIKNVPLEVNTERKLVVDGEVIIRESSFKEFNAGGGYANPRNLAAGSLSLLDPKEAAARPLEFVAWSLIEPEDSDTYDKAMAMLHKLGFAVVPNILVVDYEETIQALKNDAVEASYPIDGIVFRINNNEAYVKRGKTEHHFSGGFALKFYDEEYETRLLGIDYDVSRQGILTPVAVFEDVDTGDSIINRASLSNLSVMTEKLGAPYVGQKLWVVKRNMIIPYVERAQKQPIDNYIELIDTCPCCGEVVETRRDGESAVLYCSNPNCSAKLSAQIVHFFSKKGLDAKGIGESVIDKLIDWGWVNSITDMYELGNHKAEWIQRAGFGEKSVQKILDAIEGSKDTTVEKYIAALGIKEIGGRASKDISKVYDTWEAFRAATFDELTDLPGIGVIMAQNIINFDYTEADLIANKYMRFAEARVADVQEASAASSSSIVGKKFVITGKLHLHKNRDELISIIEQAGGVVSSAVSKNTDFLINNDNTSTSAKNKKAQELGIPIITEEDLATMMK